MNLPSSPDGGAGAAAGFVHLHVHSHFSFLDSTLSVDRVVELAARSGSRAVALTDTNSLSGAVMFAKAARAAGLKPIVGAEVREPLPRERALLRARAANGGDAPRLAGAWDDDGPDGPAGAGNTGTPGGRAAAEGSHSPSLWAGDPDRRAVLLARDRAGYAELNRVLTRRALDPGFDLARELAALGPAVAVFSDCPALFGALATRAGEVPAPARAAQIVPSRRRRVRNRAVYEAAARLGLPLLVAADVKLAAADDAPLHALLRAMAGLTTIHALPASERIDPARRFLSEEEIRTALGLDGPGANPLRAELAAAMANTLRLADLCADDALPLGEWKFPLFGPEGTPPAEALRLLVDAGLAIRYGDPPGDEPRRRAAYELGVIDALGFTQYFLLVRRIVAECRLRGFHTVGRGSAANSIVSYALDISNVCPIRHDLYFERFLNPGRTAPPDIDMDLSWRERDEILEWCFSFFGPERVALVSTVQTFQTRQAVREVAKAHGLPDAEISRFNGLMETGYRVDDGPGGGGAGGGGRGAGRVRDMSAEEPWATVLAMARRVEGFPRHLSVHCGGLVVAPGAVTDVLPLSRSAKGYAITQMDMFGVEDLGLVKIDLLGNRSLGVLSGALALADAAPPTTEELEFAGGAGALGVASADAAGALAGNDPSLFQREAVRMKLAGTRRGTSVALMGVLKTFHGDGGPGGEVGPSGHSAVAPHTGPRPLRRRVFDFAHVTGDPATRALIDAGRTMGCFYIESPGMRALFERLRCQSYEEVVAASSIIRPGVAESGMMDEYIERHRGRVAGPPPLPAPAPPPDGAHRLATGRMPINAHAKPRPAWVKGSSPRPAPHPVMMEILPDTHGVMVYQEDVLRVASRVAGMTLGEADLLRRAMSGKARSDDAMARLEHDFLSGALARGLPDADAREVWRQVSSFAGYSFCKGHSASFAVLSYQIAYLKAHRPAEFFAALLSNQGGFYGAHAYLEEARRWGLDVLGPSVDHGDSGATAVPGDYDGRTDDPGWRPWVAWAGGGGTGAVPEGRPARGWVRVGLTAVVGLGAKARLALVADRAANGPFRTVAGFAARALAVGVGEEGCRVLARAGALDHLMPTSGNTSDPLGWKSRNAVLMALECQMARLRVTAGDLLAGAGVVGVSGFADDPAGTSAAEVATPATLAEACRLERETLGFAVSAHPLDLVALPHGLVQARDIRDHAGRRVRMAGWRISAKLLAARDGRGTMKMLTLEDRTDTFEAVLFPPTYRALGPRTLGRGPYLVTGRIDMKLGSPTLNVEDLAVLSSD